MARRDEFIQIAGTVPFDNTTAGASGMTSTDTQAAIEELKQATAVSASPGFTWGSSGNIPSGSYLLNDTVPSNRAGRLVPVSGGSIQTIFVTAEIANTFDVIIQRNILGVFTTLVTVSMIASRKNTFSVNIPVSLNDEIAVKIDNGSAKNPVVGVVIKGVL